MEKALKKLAQWGLSEENLKKLSTLLTEGKFGTGFIPGLVAVACIAAIVVYLCKKADGHVKTAHKVGA